MFKSRVFIFILLALAALVLQLVVNKGQLRGQRCCPRSPDVLMVSRQKVTPAATAERAGGAKIKVSRHDGFSGCSGKC